MSEFPHLNSYSSYPAQLHDAIAKLRTAFFKAVPAALTDHRFPEMMGSPLSVILYVTLYFEALAKKTQEP